MPGATDKGSATNNVEITSRTSRDYRQRASRRKSQGVLLQRLLLQRVPRRGSAA